jgi:hypothetical protein
MKIRQYGATIGEKVAREAGGPCVRLISIQFRFHKGTEKLYCINLTHFANVPQNPREKPHIIFIRITIKITEPGHQPGYENRIDKWGPTSKTGETK